MAAPQQNESMDPNCRSSSNLLVSFYGEYYRLRMSKRENRASLNDDMGIYMGDIGDRGMCLFRERSREWDRHPTCTI